jgi:hypothetical protein
MSASKFRGAAVGILGALLLFLSATHATKAGDAPGSEAMGTGDMRMVMFGR